MLHVRPVTDDYGFGKMLCDFVGQIFPANLDNGASLLDALTSAFVSSLQNRFGAAPTPEQLVAIRQVISLHTENDLPISVLVPWGSKKGEPGHTVDIAELSAIRQLEALQERIKRVYKPGIIVDMAIENLGGQYLWQDEGKATLADSDNYVRDMVRLVRVLGFESWLKAVPESQIVDYKTFATAADEFCQPLLDAISKAYFGRVASVTSPALNGLGWRGGVSREMVDFYMNQYFKMYPHHTEGGRVAKLASYLAQSAARYKVGAKVYYVAWTKSGYVQINFPLPVPGIPEHLGMTRLYYRTMPLRFTKNHMPPWRAIGYLKVNPEGTMLSPKLVSWNDPVAYNLVPQYLELSSEEERVEIEARILLPN